MCMQLNRVQKSRQEIAFMIETADGVKTVYLFNDPRSVHSGPTVSGLNQKVKIKCTLVSEVKHCA
jgi:hypothetical protein